MFRLIINIIILLFLAVLIVFNLDYKTSFSLFGLKMIDIPVIAVALSSFVLGVIYSFGFYLANYLGKLSKNRIKVRGDKAQNLEQELVTKDKKTTKSKNSKTAKD